MKMKMKMFFFILVVIIFSIIFFLADFFPVFCKSNKTILPKNFVIDSVFNPIENLDLNKKTVVYLIFSQDDLNSLPKKMGRSKVLFCSDKTILTKLKSVFYFSKLKGDMATCDSQIIIYNDGNKIFQSGILISKNLLGLQNKVTGWSESCHRYVLTDLFSNFKARKCVFINGFSICQLSYIHTYVLIFFWFLYFIVFLTRFQTG